MRKGLSILLAAMLALASAQAQTTISTFPYFHEFGYEYDGLEGWTTASQSDNEESTAWQEYYSSLYSVSFYNNYYDDTYEYYSADEWLISPQVSVNVSALVFELDMGASYYGDPHVQVYVATSNTIDAFMATAPLLDTVVSYYSDGLYQVSLDAYQGQNVYVALRYLSNAEMEETTGIYVYTAGFRSTNTPVISLSVNKSNMLQVGETDSVFVTLTEGSEDGLSYSWTSTMMENGTATYTTNTLGDTLAITYTQPGVDTIYLTVANAYDTVYDTIYYQVVDFEPFAITAEESYMTGFEEEEDQNWYIFSDEGPNKWYLDTNVRKDGQYGLYVSNTGLDNKYTYNTDWGTSNPVYCNSTSMAVRAFTIADTGSYAINFNWRCDGEASGTYYSDYMQVFLAKSFNGVNSNTYEWLDVTGKLANQTTWQTYGGVVDLDASWIGNVYVVVYWYNDGSATNNSSNPMAAAFDNFSMSIAACTAPTELIVEDITTTTATASWTAGGSETNWAYSLDGGEYVAVSSPYVSLTDLNPGSSHTIAVRAVCDVEENVASIDVTTSFFTECAPIANLPWEEDFESYVADYSTPAISVLNPCWASGTTYPYSSNYPNVNAPYNMTGKFLYFYSYSYYNSYTYAVLPEFADSIKNLEMSLDAYASYGTGYLYVGVMDTNVYTDSSVFDTVSVLTITNNEYETENYVVSFSEYAGDGKYIILFKAPDNGASEIYIDKVEVYPAPTCPRPTKVVRAAATDASITASWRNTGAVEYEASLRASDGDGDWTTQVVTDTFATFNNLVPGSLYSVRVRAICDGSDTSYATTATLRTLCLYDTFPYAEYFDDPADKECWIVLNGNGSSYDDWSISDYTMDGNYYAYTSSVYTGDPNPSEHLISPIFSIPSDASEYLTLLFQYIQYSDSYYTGQNKLYILACVDGNPLDASNYTDTLMTITDYSETWSQYSVNVSQYAGHNVNFAFYRTSDGGQVGSLYVSNIEVRESKEPKINVLGATFANIGYDNEMRIQLAEGSSTGIVYEWASQMVAAGQATVSYNADNSIATFNYSVAGYDTIMVTAVNSFGEDTVYVPVFARDLHAITTLPYSTGFENDADNALWNRSKNTSGWYIDTAVAYTGNKSLYISADGGLHNKYSAVNNESVTAHAYRGIVLDSGVYYITFDWTSGGSSYDGYFRPMLFPADTPMPDSTYLSYYNYDYIDLSNGTYFASSSNWSHYLNTFVITEPGLYLLDFYWYNYTSGARAAAIDNLSIGLLTCPAPLDVYAETVTATSAGISWSVAGNESQWEITVGDDDPVVVDTPYYFVEHLEPYTTYNISVRAICGEGDTSFAVNSTFRTECDLVMTLPWVEDFDSYTYSNNETEIACWNHLGGGRQSINRNITLSGNSDTDRSLRISRTSNDSSDFVTVLPAFHATIAALEMNFYARPDNGSAGTLEIGYMTDPTEMTTFVSLATYNANDSATFYSAADSSFQFVLKNVSFANAPDGSRMAIRTHVEGYFYGNWYIDSVEVKVIEGVDPYACAVPTDITSTRIMDGVYQLNWSAGTETKWKIEITHDGNTEVRTVQNRPYTISPLQADDHYYIRVKAICALTAESDWSEVYDLNTATPIDTTSPGDTTGIADVLAGSFSLMPNPASSTVTVKLSNVEGTAMVAIIDMNGRKASEWTVEDGSLTIDLSNYARGAYFVRVVANEGTAVRKLIVQ